MSWLWSSSKTKEVTSTPVPANEQLPEVVPDLPEPQISQNITQTLSRDEQSNQELIALLKEFQSQAENEKEERIKSRESGTSSKGVQLPGDISEDSLYPTELSCRSAFDYALFCQSFGGQFVNIYRYGSFRSCSNHWQDFWLCMRTRNWKEMERKKAIQDHYKQKTIKWKTGPSSEDIWNLREEPVKDAFQDNLEELEAKIEEWKRANPGVSDPWDKQQGSTFSTPSG